LGTTTIDETATATTTATTTDTTTTGMYYVTSNSFDIIPTHTHHTDVTDTRTTTT
jgi:hypothetical protein